VNRMKKIMILGASILQLPAIIKAKEMGLQVIAVDMDKNAVGFKHADVCLEISTIDIYRVVEAAKQYKIDGVMTLASDMPMRTVAAVAKELNLVGVSEETALKATNKAVMRDCLNEHRVPIPKFYKVQNYDSYLNAIQQISGKLIVKPADNSGSRGIYLLRDINDKKLINYAFKYSKKYSRTGEIVVEEFMEGPEVSVETLSIEGEVHIIAITDKITTGAPRFVEMGHSQPSLLPNDVIRDIQDTAVAAVSAIGIKNGPAHTEIIVTSRGAKIVELGARLGGDCITTHLVPLSTGVDMVKCCLQLALGEIPIIHFQWNRGSAIRFLDSYAGMLKEIHGVEEAMQIIGVHQISFSHYQGETISNIRNSADRVGFVIAQAENAAKAIEVCEKARKKIQLEIR
jgi:biotin carboxylase